MFLAPDGLTVVIISDDTVLCYSWNHNNAQFDPFHFTDEAHLVGFEHAYSPDGKLVACQSLEDSNIRFWDTQTGQLCGKPITSDSVNTMVLSPALKDQSLGDRIIAVSCSNIISVYDIHTSHLYARFYASAIPIGFTCVPFMQGGTKLAFNDGQMGIWDLRAGYSHGRSFILKGMKNGWMMSQDNVPLFWVPSKHREFLWVPLPKTVIAVPRGKVTSLDLSTSRLGNEWMECIDKGWLKALEEKEGKRKLLE